MLGDIGLMKKKLITKRLYNEMLNAKLGDLNLARLIKLGYTFKLIPVDDVETKVILTKDSTLKSLFSTSDDRGYK